jgi:hypothetical protein
LLTDRSFFLYWLNRWQSSPARFEYYHPCLWRTLDGGWHLGGPPPLVPPQGQNLNPPPPTTTPLPDPVPDPGQGPIPSAVPEPGSWLLLLSGLALVPMVLGRLPGAR